MNILLIGGAGYISTHTAVALAKSEHQVFLYDNLSNSYHCIVERLFTILGKKVVFIEGDIRDTIRLTKYLCTEKIDIVFDFTHIKHALDTVLNANDYHLNNLKGISSILDAMRAAQIKNFIFCSSSAVYGPAEYYPIDEKHPTNPITPYGLLKLHQENLLHDLVQNESGWNIICLRHFNVAGAHDSGLIGEYPRGTPGNLMPNITRVVAGHLSHLRIFGNNFPTPDGTCVRDYTHVMDIADGHLAAVNFLLSHPGWHTMNLGTGHGTSIMELIQAFERVSGKTIPVQFMPMRRGDLPSCYANPTLAERTMGWKAHRTIDDICASVYQYHAVNN